MYTSAVSQTPRELCSRVTASRTSYVTHTFKFRVEPPHALGCLTQDIPFPGWVYYELITPAPGLGEFTLEHGANELEVFPIVEVTDDVRARNR